jgi:hemerythrin-like domain-containing protein
LILRALAGVERYLDGHPAPAAIDPGYIDVVVDFLRTYADRCHHGKEEDILFRELARKPLDAVLAQTMAELLQEHAHARATTSRLVQANARYRGGDEAARSEIAETARELVAFYPVHIEKEDRHFFKPVMEYFTEEERAGMLREFAAFDQMLIHEKYGHIAEQLGEGRAG